MITTFDLLPKIKSLENQIPHVKTVIFIEGHRQPISDITPRIKVVPLATVEQAGHSPDAKKLKFSPPSADDPAIIMYTSGSTVSALRLTIVVVVVVVVIVVVVVVTLLSAALLLTLNGCN